MAIDGRPMRLSERWSPAEQGLADLLDPVALEERLKDARVRRAAALALRGDGLSGDTQVPVPPRSAALLAGFAEPDAAFDTPPPSLLPQPPVQPVPPEAAALAAARSPASPFDPPQADPAPSDPAPSDLVSSHPVLSDPLPVAAPVPDDPAYALRPDAGLDLEPAAEAAPAAAGAPHASILSRIAAMPLWMTFLTGTSLGAGVVALVLLAATGREATAPASPAASPERVTASVAPSVETASLATYSEPAPVRPVPAAPEASPAAPAHPVATLPEPAEPAPVAASPVVAAAPPSSAPAPATQSVLPLPAADPVPVVDQPAATEAALPTDVARAALPQDFGRVIAPMRRPRPAAPPTTDAADLAATTPGALPVQVTVHYPSGAGGAATAAADALRAAGVESVQTIPVGFAITRSNVRFYHDGDQGAASTVAGLLPADGDGTAPLARDFTDYATPAARGTLEVWLAGDPAAGGTRVARTGTAVRAPRTPLMPVSTAPVSPATPLQAPDPSDSSTQAAAVARILVERAYDRLLGQAQGNP